MNTSRSRQLPIYGSRDVGSELATLSQSISTDYWDHISSTVYIYMHIDWIYFDLLGKTGKTVKHIIKIISHTITMYIYIYINIVDIYESYVFICRHGAAHRTLFRRRRSLSVWTFGLIMSFRCLHLTGHVSHVSLRWDDLK